MERRITAEDEIEMLISLRLKGGVKPPHSKAPFGRPERRGYEKPWNISEL
jgi:hypothetical protein